MLPNKTKVGASFTQTCFASAMGTANLTSKFQQDKGVSLSRLEWRRTCDKRDKLLKANTVYSGTSLNKLPELRTQYKTSILRTKRPCQCIFLPLKKKTCILQQKKNDQKILFPKREVPLYILKPFSQAKYRGPVSLNM